MRKAVFNAEPLIRTDGETATAETGSGEVEYDELRGPKGNIIRVPKVGRNTRLGNVRNPEFSDVTPDKLERYKAMLATGGLRAISKQPGS